MALKINPIPIPSGAHHPDVPYDILPQHEFSLGVIAPKGSGKTTLIMNLLMFYKGYFNNIFIFSPTIHADEKWEYIKKQPLRVENKALKKFIEDMKDQTAQQEVVGPLPPSEKLKQFLPDKEDKFDPHIPEENYYTEYEEEDLEALMQEQSALIAGLEEYDKTKHLADRVLIVFDDLVGSTLFSNKPKSVFKKLNANLRHHSFSIILISQAYKEITKMARTQFSAMIMFEIPNSKEVEAIYEENPMSMKNNDWMEAYEYCTQDDFGFMYINYQKPKRMRVMKNFDQYVFIGKEEKYGFASDDETEVEWEEKGPLRRKKKGYDKKPPPQDEPKKKGKKRKAELPPLKEDKNKKIK